MSESKENSESGGAAGGAEKGPSKAPLFIALGNTLVALMAVGMFYYTRVMFKRPAITEEGERARLEKLHESPAPPPKAMLINLDPITFNIAASPGDPKPADGTNQQIKGKLHYATVGLSFELRDGRDLSKLDEIKPVVLDTVITMMGHKRFDELTSVQGRYLLRGELMDKINELARQHTPTKEGPSGKPVEIKAADSEEKPDKEILISGIYFTQFVVQ